MDFHQRVFSLVKFIPAGQVATYGQIAAALGSPRAARMVGTALAHCPSDVPWQRIINRHGMISIENLHVTKDEQAAQLRSEGVPVELRDGNFYVDLITYGISSQTLLDQAQAIPNIMTSQP